MANIRKEYLVVYDIEENKIRNKLFDRFKDFGLTPIQKSVFFGELSIAERKSLQRDIEEHLKKSSNDKILILEIEVLKNKGTFFLGHKEDDFRISNHGII